MEKIKLLFPMRLTEAIMLKGLSYKAVAEATGMNYISISAYATGKKAPNLMAATKIAHALDIPISWLCAYEITTEEEGRGQFPWEV